jgi:hypothetical protein
MSDPQTEVYPAIEQLGINVQVVRGKLDNTDVPEWFIRIETKDNLEWRVVYDDETCAFGNPEKIEAQLLGDEEDE